MSTRPARERSLWAWGWADCLPDAAETQKLGRLAAAVLGSTGFMPRNLPRLETINIREPRIPVPSCLSGFTTSETKSRALHTYGKSYRDLVRALAGDFAIAPDLVATPASEAQLSDVLEWAGRADVAVLPFGGGTSVVGGTEASVPSRFQAALSLDMRRFDKVLKVEPVSLSARIGAGATGLQLESELAQAGLSLRFYPQSFEFSTLGGWIATRAGGHFATLETHIDDLVVSCRAISPSGVWQTSRLPASGAGPSPDRLMLGSEGALGIITEAWVRVRPRPSFRSRAVVAFGDYHGAIKALRAVAQARLYPANARLLDSREAMLHRVQGPAGKHLLLLGFESSDRPMDVAMGRAVALARSSGGVLTGDVAHFEGEQRRGDDGADSWRNAFLRTPYLFSALVSLGIVVDTFETAVSWDRFAELHREVKGTALETMRSMTGTGLVTSRITHIYPDGLAPYYTFMTTAPPGAELEVWSAVKEAVSDALVRCGGTITHHHAVGRVHDRWYRKQRPPLFGAALAATKKVLDPHGIMNPGVIV